MFGKGALVAALAVAAAPHAEAFSHPGAAALVRAPVGAVATPALRRGVLASRPATPAFLRAAPALEMSAASDLCDVTIDMIKRIEKNLGDLDDIKLARVSAWSLLAPLPSFWHRFVPAVWLLSPGVSRWELPPQALGEHAGISDLSSSCRSRLAPGFGLPDTCTRALCWAVARRVPAGRR